MGGTARVSALMLALFATSASAGPWTKELGDGEVILTTSYYQTDSVFDSDRDKESIPADGEFTKLAYRIYTEVALADQLTFIGKAEVDSLKFEDDLIGSETHAGLADPEVGLRFRIRKPPQQGDLAMAMQGNLKIPVANSDRGSPPVDFDQWDLDLRFLMGLEFGRGYWAVEMGPRFRRGPPADELHLDTVVSVDLIHDELALVNEDFLTIGLKNQEGDSTTDGNVVRAPNYDLLVHQISLLYRVSQQFHFQGGFFHHLWGRNIGGDGGAFVAFHLKW